MAIYTRTGDKGKTSLMGGKRVLKSDERVEAYGTVDELNSVIGMVLSELTADKKFVTLREELLRIQNDLLDIGSSLATPEGLPVVHLRKPIYFCLFPWKINWFAMYSPIVTTTYEHIHKWFVCIFSI